MDEIIDSEEQLENEIGPSNTVVTNGTASPLERFKNAPRQAKTLPLVGSLTLSNCDPLPSSPTSSTPSPTASTDKTDNPDSFGFLHKKPDMRIEEERLKSFEKWPVMFLSPKVLASNGFYYLGVADEVRCAFCKVEIMRWVEGDDPAKDHQRWAPQCPFLRKQSASTSGGSTDMNANGRDECGARANTSREPVRMPGPVHPQYATETARLASFKDWPRSMPQKPEDLAAAGFFYTGKSDKTKCFYCDGGLKDWESDDVPWEQHARWFDRCAYVQLVKGRDYVQKVISEAYAIRTPEEKPAPAPEPANQTDKLDHDENQLEDSKICKICFAEERNVCFVPCGHVVACAKCALSTNKCPMCRQTFTNAIRLYFS